MWTVNNNFKTRAFVWAKYSFISGESHEITHIQTLIPTLHHRFLVVKHCFNKMTTFSSRGFSFLRIRRCPDCFIFISQIPVQVRWHLYIEKAPRSRPVKSYIWYYVEYAYYYVVLCFVVVIASVFIGLCDKCTAMFQGPTLLTLKGF